MRVVDPAETRTREGYRKRTNKQFRVGEGAQLTTYTNKSHNGTVTDGQWYGE